MGIEIGTYIGDNAKSILKTLDIKKLFLIDPYKLYVGSYDYVRDNGEVSEKIAHKKLKQWEDKIVWIKRLSSECLNEIPNNLDFVYIDGNHSYEYVEQDIKNYWDKVKIGGIFGGHDIDKCKLTPGREKDKQVLPAVLEFVNKYNLELNIRDSDW